MLTARTVGNIAPRQEHLGDGVAVLRKELIIGVHQLALTDGGGRLLGGDIGGATVKPELADAHTDRAGGDQHDLVPCIFQIRKNTAERLDAAHVEMPRVIHQCRCTNLNNNSHFRTFLGKNNMLC